MKEQRDYWYYDARCRDRYNRRCIDGHITGSGDCVGYCEYYVHSGFLTEKLRKQKDCLGKECFHYKPRAKRPSVRKVSKEQKIKNIIFEIVDGYEGLKATRIVADAKDGFLVKFITITNGYSIPEIENKLSTLIDAPVKMQKVECDFNRAAEIIFD